MRKFLVTFLVVFSLCSLSRCGLVKSGLAYFQAPDDFAELVPNSGVFFEEEGARALAQEVVTLLPNAVTTIEKKQYQPFEKPVSVFFDFPEDIRRMIYTTNAIEILTSLVRKSVRIRGYFPNDQAAGKAIFSGDTECGNEVEITTAVLVSRDGVVCDQVQRQVKNLLFCFEIPQL
jgi:hypothetical protein